MPSLILYAKYTAVFCIFLIYKTKCLSGTSCLASTIAFTSTLLFYASVLQLDTKYGALKHSYRNTELIEKAKLYSAIEAYSLALL